MSRLTSMQGIRVLSKTNEDQEMDIQNIVFTELLDGVEIQEIEKQIPNYQIDLESDWSSVYSDY